MNEALPFQDGEQILLLDQRGKRHLIFLRKSETFHSDRGWVPHDAIIGQPEGSWVRSSMGLRYIAVRPTLAEYVLEMPRGAQVIYPKDLAIILFWADIYPGCRVLEAGMGSGALTLALLRAVGPDGRVITFEQRDEFARRALANIHMRIGEVTNLTVRLRPVEEGMLEEEPVDRVVFDLPEPWRLTAELPKVLRPGGIFLSYVPTIIQAHQTSETLRRDRQWALVETFETLFRPWNIEGQSVRPFHRMVAHTGFITVARRVVPEEQGAPPPATPGPGRGRRMITVMRRYRRVLQVGLLVVIAAFVVTSVVVSGSGTFRSGVPEDSVATVNGETIPTDRYRRRYQAYVDAYAQVYRDRFTPELAERMGLSQQVVQDLVLETLVVQRARTEGLEVTDAELNAQIQAIPAFQENGRFAIKRYQEFLKRRGLSATVFEADVRREFTRLKTETTIRSGVKVVDAEIEQAWKLRNEGVRASWALVEIAPLASAVQVTDPELETYLKAHESEYRQPERRKVTVRAGADPRLHQAGLRRRDREVLHRARQ